MASAAAEAGGRQVLALTAGGQDYAVPAAEVREIIRPPVLTRCPLAPSCLMGLANLRGVVLPVVSLAALAAGDAPAGLPPPVASPRIVVVETPAPVGLWVDATPVLADAGDRELAPLQAWLERAFGAALPAALPGRRGEGRTARGLAGPESARGETKLILFSVAGEDYALKLQDVLETLALPEGTTRLPGTGPEMLGVTQRRGALLPLVSLRALLGHPPAGPAPPPASVIVTRIGDHAAGLVVDRLHAIFRAADDTIGTVPAVLTRGRGEARLSAIWRHEDGRLIPILSTGGLFDAATIGRILAAGAAPEAPEEAEQGGEDAPQRFVGFRLGAEQYGIPAGTVEEVLRRPGRITRIPHAPDFLTGLINVRGRAVPLIDQRARFGVPAAGDAPARLVMIVSVEGRQAGLCIDGVTGMLTVRPSQLSAAPAFTTRTAPVIDRIACIEREGRMIILVNAAALLTEAARDALAALGEPRPALTA